MLEYKVNRNIFSNRFQEIGITDRTVVDDGSNITIQTESENIVIGDEVQFLRQEGGYIKFTDYRNVETSKDGVISVSSFSKIGLTIDSVEVKTGKWWKDDAEGEDTTFMIFRLNKRTPHNTVLDRTQYNGSLDYIKPTIVSSRDVNHHCVGDFVLYGEGFLYEVDSVVDGVYYLNATGSTLVTMPCFKNIADVKLEIVVPFIDIYGLTSGETAGNNWEISGDTLILSGCIVPVVSSGEDDAFTLIWPCGNEALRSEIPEHLNDMGFFVEDRRFLSPYSASTTEKYLLEGTQIRLNNKTLKLFGLFGSTDDVRLGVEDSINAFIQREADKNKNGIIDYEKQVFIPVYNASNNFNLEEILDSDLKDVTEIKFNLHFRDRWSWNGNKRVELAKDWKTDDNKFWNNYEYDETMFPDGSGNTFGGVKDREGLLVSDGDLVGHLGFTDDDIYYRKNKVTKSFLRLAFYDTKNRANQKLLFTSTIFLNADELYNTYVTLISDDVTPNSDIVTRDGAKDMAGYVLTEATSSEGKRLAVEFSCRNKYDSTTSSEGFYLYLFPSLLKGLPEVEGMDPNVRAIYMKAEFNHAKYGYKVPLTMPTLSDDEYCYPSDVCFPVNYMRQKGPSGGTYIDTSKLFSDMYARILIKYDDSKKRYVWMFPRKEDAFNGKTDGKVVINLFEPKINGGERDSYIDNTYTEIRKNYANLNCGEKSIDTQSGNSITLKYYVPVTDTIRLYKRNFKTLTGDNEILHLFIDSEEVSKDQVYFRLLEGEHEVVFFFRGTAVPNSMFAGNEYVTELVKVDGITSIGTNSFSGCHSLRSANLSGVTGIFNQAFQGDVFLEEITNTESLGGIGNGAFGRTALVTLPAMPSLTSVGDFAFSKCYKLINTGDIMNVRGDEKGGIFMDCPLLYSQGNHSVRLNYTDEYGNCNNSGAYYGRNNTDMFFNFNKKKLECGR